MRLKAEGPVGVDAVRPRLWTARTGEAAGTGCKAAVAWLGSVCELFGNRVEDAGDRLRLIPA